MRILAIPHSLGRSGAPIALCRLLTDLAATHDIRVLLNGSDTALRPVLEASGVATVEKVDPKGFDVVLCNTLVTAGMVCRVAPRRPVVWWIHEGLVGRDLIRRGHVDPAAFAAAREVVFPTAWQGREVFAPWLKGRSWSTVPMGVPEPPRGQPAPFARREGEFVLVHVGRIERRKGQDLTVGAVRRLADPGLRVFFIGESDDGFDPGIGDGEGDGEGARFVRTGSLPAAEVAAYMEHADALVLPTRDDLIPLVVQEAMQHGTCVLTSDFGPIPELVRHGRTGLLSPVNDDRVLAGNIAMVRRDADLRRLLGEAGREEVAGRHAFPAHRDGMLRILERAAAKG